MNHNALLLTGLVLVGALSPAGDWPQILGPSRSGHAEGETIQPWTDAPQILWKFECGSGYGGVAMAGGRVYLNHRVEDNNLLTCFDAESGGTVWTARFPATYRGGYNADTGPRCVPVVSGGQVFCYSAAGTLAAFDTANGKLQWTRTLREDFAAEDGYFGAGASPIVAAGNVIVPVGGESGVVAVHCSDGEEAWKATTLEADYASPVMLDADTVVVPMRMQTVGLFAINGNQEFKIPFGQRGLNVIGVTPSVSKNLVLLSASYRIGAKLVDASGPSLKTIWENDDTLSSQYNSGVIIDDFVYGIHGREDQGVAELRCVELQKGRVAWSKPGFGVAHLIAAGETIIALTVTGKIELFSANSSEFKPLCSFELPRGTYRALPALSGGKLVCRSTDRGQGTLYAIDLTAAK